jgi:integrase
MARPLKLKARKLPNGKWQLNVIAKLSESGKRERLEFPNQAAAVAKAEELRCRRDNLATAGGGLTTAQILDAISALEILGERSITLTEAAQIAMKAAKARLQSITFKDLFAQFALIKKNKSLSQRRAINWAIKRLAGLEDRFVRDITRNDIAAPLADLAVSSRENILKTVRALFRYGKELEFLEDIPVRPSDFSEKARTEIKIIPVGKIRAILEAALKHDVTVLPALLAETFCGVRPEEVKRLLGTDFNLLRREVIIRASVSKTGTARRIKLEPAFLAWWDLCIKAMGPIKDELVSFSETKFREKVRKVRYHAGYRGAGARWTPGALRDAFCSYHLNHFNSIDRLIQEAGHTNLRTTLNHYLGLVSVEAAQEFWDLMPAGKQGKVIKFDQAQAA